jgi:hypothetical protein
MKKSPRKVAEQFIHGQMRIMAKYGEAPKPSKARIAHAVGLAEKSFKSLACQNAEKLELR